MQSRKMRAFQARSSGRNSSTNLRLNRCGSAKYSAKGYESISARSFVRDNPRSSRKQRSDVVGACQLKHPCNHSALSGNKRARIVLGSRCPGKGAAHQENGKQETPDWRLCRHRKPVTHSEGLTLDGCPFKSGTRRLRSTGILTRPVVDHCGRWTRP